MNMKDCPSCGITVPESATRCKGCFHGFDEAPPRSHGGPLVLLAALAAMAVVGAFTLWWVASGPVEERILVDQESQMVVWTRMYHDGVQTDRLPFHEIASLEYISSPNHFQVVAVTASGERKLITEDVQPLKSTANQYAHVMRKPLSEVDQSGNLTSRRE